ncbi:hypothetical protein IEQ34_005970 [Dendrobium chrysotoxum]|uniref:Protein SCAR n=1 Tax=Dendrobium chrysotoxum TaxID=161865 RepID=A0AAV7HAE4_DENCH|nr:hypothetical protein IEQ34_005970 [Dendrobium chrysotoxum]
MPTVKVPDKERVRVSGSEVYRAADKDDPEALLEGVAMAGLVGVLRQLGDLAEFAAEVFHNLHEEVMATSARGHGLMLRVLQLEADFPSIEKAILSETDHSHCAYSAGIDWHANLRVEQNLIVQGDMPRFILDSYEECRGPPRLFMLDKFDVAGAGACLTRYSNPSFFKTASAFSEMMEEAQREKRARKPKKKGWRSGETTASFFAPIIDYFQFTASEPVPGKFPAKIVKLKHRKLRVSDVSSRKSYMDGFLKEESFEQNDSKSSLRGYPNNKIIDGAPDIQKVLNGGVNDPLLVRQEFFPQSLKEVTGKVQNPKRGDFLETLSVSSSVSQKVYPNSQNAKEALLMELGNEVDIHAFDISSDEIDMNPPLQQLAVQNNNLAVSGFITDDDHDSYRSDDIGSELENYVDALNIMESEIETDPECRAKSDPSLFKLNSLETHHNINGQLELQPQSCRSGIVGNFDTSVSSEKMKDGMHSLSQSTVLVDLPDQQLMVGTVFEETSSLKINHGETGKLERMSEDMTLVSSACLTSNETCYQKQPNAAMVVPISREAFTSYCVTDSDLKPQPNVEEAQSLALHSEEAISGSTKYAPVIDEHVDSSFPSWQTNHAVVFPTCKERADIPTDILEEMNPIEFSEDRISLNITDEGYMQCASSETEHGILSEKALAECSKDLSTLFDDGIEKPLEVSEPDKNDYISGSSLPTIPMASTLLESQDSSYDLEIDIQSEGLAMKISPTYMEGKFEERKQLNSSVLFPAGTDKLHLVESIDRGSYGSTQTSENVDDNLAYISDERGSPHGSRNNSATGLLSGYTEKKKSNDLINTLETSEPPQTQAESSLMEVCYVCGKDSLHDSVEKDNEANSVENLSPKSSDFALGIVSSILKSESFANENGNISATQEEFVHPQLPSSSGKIDTLGCGALVSPTIPYELEHFPAVDEPQESSNVVMLKTLPSSCREDPDANQLHREESELFKTNGEERVCDGLEFTNDSTKLSVQHDVLLLVDSKNNSVTGNGIPKDSINDQVLNVQESTKVTTFDVLLQEDPLSEDDTLHQPYSDVKEPDITRDSTSLQSENKAYLLFTENEEIEMFFNSVSRRQSSSLDLSNSSEARLVDVNEVKLCSRENDQHSDSKSENVIIKDDTADGEVLSLLQSSNVCNFDVQFQEDTVSEDADLNPHKPVLENLNGANSDSKFSIVTEDGTDGQILCLSESSNLYSFDVQIQEDSVSEDVYLNQHKPEIQEPAIASDLTSLNFENKLLAPLCENADQNAVGIVSSSQLQDLNLSNLTCVKLADHYFDDIYMEESLKSSREDEQHSDSDSSMLHFQAEAESLKVPSEKASVSQAGDEPTTAPLYRVLENIEPSSIQLDEDSSDEPTIIPYNLEHEGLISEPVPETLLKHKCMNELSIPSSKASDHEQKETHISVSFEGISEHPGSSMDSEALASGSLVADFIIPNPTFGTQETLKALTDETISSFPIQEGIEETPPLPPLPPMQWRMGKPQLGSLITCEPQPMMKTNPFIFTSNTGSSMHINPFPGSSEKMNQHAGPFVSPLAFEESFQNASSCTDGQSTESLKLSEFPVITLDQRQHHEIYSSGLSLLASSKEDEKHSHGNITMNEENPVTDAPSLKDMIPQDHDLLVVGNPQAIKERRPKLVKLLPGLELERSLEAPIIDRDANPPFSSFTFMPTAGDAMYQYGYGDYGGYGGDSMHYQKLSAPFPVALQGIPHYAYHMFLREGSSSAMYDMLQDMEGDKPSEKQHSILNRPRDPLIEAVAAHDKSTVMMISLRKVSELDRALMKPKEAEKNHLLEQIKTKSLNLKPATSKANMVKAPSTNLKVAAILEKANAIRQVCHRGYKCPFSLTFLLYYIKIFNSE